MSNRKDITEMLARNTEYYLNPKQDTRVYTAKEVTFDYASENRIRVDYMEFKPVNNTISGIEKGDVDCYEIKSSVDDFRSKNGHNFIGDFNYYVMPDEVFNTVKDDIPFGIGVLVPSGETLVSRKPARRQARKRSVSEVLLMMFRSANRELFKK